MKTFQERLVQGIALASEGKVEKALAELDTGLKQALKRENHRWTIHFSRNLGLLYDQIGNLNKAKKYYSIALRYNKSDPSSYYLLGDLYERLGKLALSRRNFTSCYQLAVKNKDEEFLEILDKRNRVKHPD